MHNIIGVADDKVAGSVWKNKKLAYGRMKANEKLLEIIVQFDSKIQELSQVWACFVNYLMLKFIKMIRKNGFQRPFDNY